MGHSAEIIQTNNINKYSDKMKFLIPLLFILASSHADKHPKNQHHNHTDIEALARKLATLIFQRIQETDNIHPIPIVQTYTAYAAVPIKSYAAEPVRTYTAAPVRTYASAPVQTYAAEPVQTYAAEPVQTYTAEPVQPYAAGPVQTYEAESIQTYAAAPVQTYPAEHVQTYEAEPVQTYVDEPKITSYRRHKTVQMPHNNNYH